MSDKEYRSIQLSERTKRLHIEAPGCIINVRHNLKTDDGKPCVSVEVTADATRYADRDGDWLLADSLKATSINVRVVKYPKGAADDPELDPNDGHDIERVLRAGRLLLMWSKIPASKPDDIDTFLDCIGESTAPEAAAIVGEGIVGPIEEGV